MRIIAGQYKNRLIQAPKGLATRPTSGRLRESLFNICQADIDQARFLDLFAGSGAMGLEALSRGAKSAVFIDNSKESQRCILANAALLKADSQSQIIYGDVFDQLKRLAARGAVFDIIYADPPYDKSGDASDEALSLKVLQFIDSHPKILSESGHLFLEDAQGALPEGGLEGLQSLRLKSSRGVGKSILQHYVSLSIKSA